MVLTCVHFLPAREKGGDTDRGSRGEDERKFFCMKLLLMICKAIKCLCNRYAWPTFHGEDFSLFFVYLLMSYCF